MANTTFDYVKAISLVDYMPAFRTKSDIQTWNWQSITSVKETNRASEQVFSYVGLPASEATGELEPVSYRSTSELEPTLFLVNKYTLGTMFSFELLADNNHIRDFLSEAGEMMGESHSFVVDAVVAETFNRAFDPLFPVYDGVELCGTHTLFSGDIYDNALPPASLTFDSIWDAIIHYETTLLSQSGIFIHDRPEWLMYHPSKQKQVEAIFESPGQPVDPDIIGVGPVVNVDNENANTLKKYSLRLIPNRHLTNTEAWFVGGSKFKNDHCFFWRDRPQVDMEDDFDRMGVKVRSFQRFANGVREFKFIVGNPGV